MSVTTIACQQDAVEYLHELNYIGKLNSFTCSLLDQYERKGYLSDKQVASLAKGLSKPKAPTMDLPPVPEGHYALDTDEGVMFYEVQIGKSGRWDGFTFLSRISGENHVPIKDPHTKLSVLSQISDDWMGALRRYGHHIGRCGICHRQLTDEKSIADGIGPECKKNLGGLS